MDILARVALQGYWTVSDIARYVGMERGSVRRAFIRGRLGCEMVSRGVRSPRGQRRFQDDPAFRWQLEQLRAHHNRADSKWQETSQSRRGRIAKLAAICQGDIATDPADRAAAADVLRALALLWRRQVASMDSPALRGALDFAPVVRSRKRFADERLFVQICQAAAMLQSGNTTTADGSE